MRGFRRIDRRSQIPMFVLGIFLILTLTKGISPVSGSDNAWHYRANMSVGREDLAAAVVNRRIYAIGGSGRGIGDENRGMVEEYNPDTNQWRHVADMPTGRVDLGAAVVNGRIYVIGGAVSGDVPLSVVEEFDPIENSWRQRADMITPRWGLAVVAVANRIFAIGGWDDNHNPLSLVEEFNPIENSWRQRASLETPRGGLTAAAVDGRIYAIDGHDGDEFLSIVEEYDLDTNQWRRRSSIAVSRDDFAATVVDGRIFAIGGTSETSSGDKIKLASVEEFSPPSNQWYDRTPMMVARDDLAAATVDSRIFAIGGYDGHTTLASVEEFNPFVSDETEITTRLLLQTITVTETQYTTIPGFTPQEVLIALVGFAIFARMKKKR